VETCVLCTHYVRTYAWQTDLFRTVNPGETLAYSDQCWTAISGVRQALFSSLHTRAYCIATTRHRTSERNMNIDQSKSITNVRHRFAGIIKYSYVKNAKNLHLSRSRQKAFPKSIKRNSLKIKYEITLSINNLYSFSKPTKCAYNIHTSTVFYHCNMFRHYCAI
jgi:hypothetical protein